jgi:hypothetical protein
MLSRQKCRALCLIAVFLCAAYLSFSPVGGLALVLINRSVTISTGQVSAVATHSFKFSLPTTSDVGSIVFDYCADNAHFDSPCTAATGADVSGAVLASQSGNIGFSIDSADSTPSKIVLTRPAAAGLMVNSTYVFNNIINPSLPGVATYVRISTHAATDGSGPVVDHGAVAFAAQNQFEVDAYVPPFLQICVGVSVAPDCSSTTGDSIDLGILSSQHANDAQSQFAVATNDTNGYNVFGLGNTMTSGNNIIQSLQTPTPSFPGTPQFGINLRANLLPPVGQDPVGLGTGIPTADYNQPNKFLFNDGDLISSSPLNSNYNRMTVSYLVNVPAGQAPGIYATTVTYLAVAEF